MIYLSQFKVLSDDDEDMTIKIKDKYTFKDNNVSIYDLYARDEHYPAGILSSKELSSIDFEDITVLYGGNGSGKTTLLNIISEKLKYTDIYHIFKQMFFVSI